MRRYQRLSETVRSKAKKQEKIFRANPFDSRLKVHKLHGRMSDFWSFYIDFKYRIVFKFEESTVVKFYSVGGHSIYFLNSKYGIKRVFSKSKN